MIRAFVLLGCFVAGAAFVARAERPESVPVRTTFDRFPMQIGEWRGRQEPPLAANILAVLGVDDYLTRTYFTNRAGIGLYIGYYGSQRQGDTMHSPQNCLPGAGWEPVENSLMPIAVDGSSGPREIVVNRYIIQKGLDRQLVLYWYQAHDRVIASEYWAKYYLIHDAVRMNRTDGALVRVITPLSGISGTQGEAAAEAQAVDFVKKLFPALNPYLPA